MTEPTQAPSKEQCPHAPVYQKTPIGEVRVGCPWCRDAEIAQLRLSHEPGNALLGAAQVLVQHYEKALRDIGACISGHDSIVCQDVADIIDKALYSDSPTQPPGEGYRFKVGDAVMLGGYPATVVGIIERYQVQHDGRTGWLAVDGDNLQLAQTKGGE